MTDRPDNARKAGFVEYFTDFVDRNPIRDIDVTEQITPAGTWVTRGNL